MRDWSFREGNTVCDLRVAGVLVKDGRLLVQRERNGQEYALPGGHVAIGEETADALKREFKEEMGLEIECGDLLWTEECFFSYQAQKAHQISFYYRISADSGIDEEFVPQKDNANVLIGWLPIERLAEVSIYPEFIRQTIHQIGGAPRHFVTRC